MAKGKGGFIGQDGLNAPDAPTGVSGTAGDTQVEISFTSPSDVGGSAITSYLVTDSTKAHTATGSSSPITVTGLTNDTAYTFNVWAINAFGWSVASDASGSVTPIQNTYALYAGGYTTSLQNQIAYFNMASSGENAQDFGDLTLARFYLACASSSTRAIWCGGQNGSGTAYNTLDYVTIATTGNATDFGDISTGGHKNNGGCSNSTRAIWSFGRDSSNTNVDTIHYSTIASTGNTTDFGNYTAGVTNGSAAFASPTRGCITRGDQGNELQYVTIASTGNTTDFGDLSNGAMSGAAGCSSSVRGLIGGGASAFHDIVYFTIASTGNSTDFGDFTETEKSGLAAASNNTSAVFMGGNTTGGRSNRIDRVTIATTGNVSDFGDLVQGIYGIAGCSDSHGGLQ